VDYSQWNPASILICRRITPKRILSGKRICKQALLAEFGFDVEIAKHRPLIGMVTRLVGQKGADLIAEIGEDWRTKR